MRGPPDEAPIPIDSFFAPEKIVLRVAIGVAAIFIGFLVFDTLRRNKGGRGASGEKEGFRAAWARRVQQAKILRQELRAYKRDRARRKEREGGKRPGTKR